MWKQCSVHAHSLRALKTRTSASCIISVAACAAGAAAAMAKTDTAATDAALACTCSQASQLRTLASDILCTQHKFVHVNWPRF